MIPAGVLEYGAGQTFGECWDAMARARDAGVEGGGAAAAAPRGGPPASKYAAEADALRAMAARLRAKKHTRAQLRRHLGSSPMIQEILKSPYHAHGGLEVAVGRKVRAVKLVSAQCLTQRYHNLIAIHCRHGRHRQAQEIIRNLLHSIDDAPAYTKFRCCLRNLLGCIHAEVGRHEDALAEMEGALAQLTRGAAAGGEGPNKGDKFDLLADLALGSALLLNVALQNLSLGRVATASEALGVARGVEAECPVLGDKHSWSKAMAWLGRHLLEASRQ